MRILHMCKYYPPFMGGMENFLDLLARQQALDGHEIRVLAHWHQKNRPTEDLQLLTNLYLTRVSMKGVLVYAPVSPEFPGVLGKILASYAPDVVHVHMPNLSAFFLLLQKKIPKLVVHWHSDVLGSVHDYKLRLFYPVYRFFEKKLLQRADVVIATSESYLKSSPALAGCRDKCRAIPLGVSLDRMDELACSSHNIENKPEILKEFLSDEPGKDPRDFILSVGRFTYYKGFKYLLEACSLGFGGRLIIVGHGPQWYEMDRLRISLGLSSRVCMPGSLGDQELHWLFGNCSAFCLPSVERTEAFGMVLLEAMYYKKPLITTSVEGSGMNEVNIHEKTGLVVPPCHPEALAGAMSYMLARKKEAEYMGHNARQRLEEKFTISEVAHELDQVYNS